MSSELARQVHDPRIRRNGMSSVRLWKYLSDVVSNPKLMRKSATSSTLDRYHALTTRRAYDQAVDNPAGRTTALRIVGNADHATDEEQQQEEEDDEAEAHETKRAGIALMGRDRGKGFPVTYYHPYPAYYRDFLDEDGIVRVEKLDRLIKMVMIEKYNLDYPGLQSIVGINNCDDGSTTTTTGELTTERGLQLSNSQAFAGLYMNNKNPVGGVVVVQSAGSGKTCLALFALSNMSGYETIWVTTKELKNNVLKEVFTNVCSVQLVEKMRTGSNTRSQSAEQFKAEYQQAKTAGPGEQTEFMRRHGIIDRVFTFEQLMNTLSGVAYRRAANMTDRATGDLFVGKLLIVDEAHKLFSGEMKTSRNRVGNEEQQAIQKFIDQVYKSRRASEKWMRKNPQDHTHKPLKLLLMTATPTLAHPMDYISLVNMCVLKESQRMPYKNRAEFDADYVAARSAGSAQREEHELNIVKWMEDRSRGVVSYLDLTLDASRFPIVTRIDRVVVELSAPQTRTMSELVNGQRYIDSATAIRMKAEAIGLSIHETMLDNREYVKPFIRRNIHTISPTVAALVKKIRKIDDDHVAAVGHPYKHAIYIDYAGTDAKSSTPSCKKVLSLMMALGFNSCFGRIDDGMHHSRVRFLPNRTPKYKWVDWHSWDRVCFLSNEKFWGQTLDAIDWSTNPQLDALRDGTKAVLTYYNERAPGLVAEIGRRNGKLARDTPTSGNNFGQNVRFILIDQNYGTGIDLHDTATMHFLVKTKGAQLTQAKGRILRRCGNKGLEFTMASAGSEEAPSRFKRWPVTLVEYDHVFVNPLKQLTVMYDPLDEQQVRIQNAVIGRQERIQSGNNRAGASQRALPDDTGVDADDEEEEEEEDSDQEGEEDGSSYALARALVSKDSALYRAAKVNAHRAFMTYSQHQSSRAGHHHEQQDDDQEHEVVFKRRHARQGGGDSKGQSKATRDLSKPLTKEELAFVRGQDVLDKWISRFSVQASNASGTPEQYERLSALLTLVSMTSAVDFLLTNKINNPMPAPQELKDMLVDTTTDAWSLKQVPRELQKNVDMLNRATGSIPYGLTPSMGRPVYHTLGADHVTPFNDAARQLLKVQRSRDRMAREEMQGYTPQRQRLYAMKAAVAAIPPMTSMSSAYAHQQG
jgi:hypothetical protein